MKSIRLIPIVLMAATALFLLKGIGLLSNGGYVLLGSGQAQAQSSTQTPGQDGASTQSDMALSTIEEAAAERAASTLFDENETPANNSEQADALPTIENSMGETAPFSTDAGIVNTEEAVLQRLSERRAQLDARENALALQEGLILAAETRMQERIDNLQIIEGRVQALIDKYNSQGEEQFDALVSMYANMKSSDAAKVFNALNMDILLRIATKMSPRKMSPILADMTVERAQLLTVRMATAQTSLGEMDTTGEAMGQPMDELPQIVGQ